MSLSCSCDSEYAWYFDIPEDYSAFPSQGRRKRCSCGELIEHECTCLKFRCWRLPKDEVEERIHGGDDAEVSIADKWLCERCADLYFSFVELGYECVHPGENMVDLAKNMLTIGQRHPKSRR